MHASSVAFLVFSFLGFILPSIAVVPQFHAERIGIFMQVFWAGGGCLLHFLNTLIWRNDALNRAPVFCDITIYFYIGMHVGVICCTLCIMYRLHNMLDVTSGAPSNKEKRRMIIVDVFIALGVPVAFMAVYYVNAGHRGDIFEEVGCSQVAYRTIVSTTTLFVAPLILALISMVYGVKNLVRIRKIYSEVKATAYFNADETANRYFRIMALSSLDLFFTIPLLVYHIVDQTAVVGLQPWISWEDTKWGFSRFDSVPYDIWKKLGGPQYELNRWSPVVVSFIWLLFFGYTSETRRVYGPILNRILGPFAMKPSHPPALEPLHFGAPAPQPAHRRRGISLDLSESFSSTQTSVPVVDRGDEISISQRESDVALSVSGSKSAPFDALSQQEKGEAATIS